MIWWTDSETETVSLDSYGDIILISEARALVTFGLTLLSSWWRFTSKWQWATGWEKKVPRLKQWRGSVIERHCCFITTLFHEAFSLSAEAAGLMVTCEVWHLARFQVSRDTIHNCMSCFFCFTFRGISFPRRCPQLDTRATGDHRKHSCMESSRPGARLLDLRFWSSACDWPVTWLWTNFFNWSELGLFNLYKRDGKDSTHHRICCEDQIR